MRKYAQRKALIMGPREKGAKLSTKAHLISQDNEEPKEWQKGEVNELCHLASVAAGTKPELSLSVCACKRKMKSWCLLQHCLFFQHHPTTQQLKVNMDVFSSLYLQSRSPCSQVQVLWFSFDIIGDGGTTKRNVKLAAQQKNSKIFQSIEIVPVHQISHKSLYIVQTSDQKRTLKIVQLLVETHSISSLNIIQINAQPFEFCMWKDSFQIFNIY